MIRGSTNDRELQLQCCFWLQREAHSRMQFCSKNCGLTPRLFLEDSDVKVGQEYEPSNGRILRKLDYWSRHRPIVFLGMQVVLEWTIRLLSAIDHEAEMTSSLSPNVPHRLWRRNSLFKWIQEFDRQLEDVIAVYLFPFAIQNKTSHPSEMHYRSFYEGYRETFQFIEEESVFANTQSYQAVISHLNEHFIAKRAFHLELFAGVLNPKRLVRIA